MKMDKILVGSVIALLAFSVVVANVFVYYPWQVTVSPVQPPIKFEKGSNADKPDLRGNTISVTLKSGDMHAEITIHPTYRVTYYKDVLRINNTDTKAYHVYIVLDETTGSLPSSSRVVLYVYGSGASRDLSGWEIPEPRSTTYYNYTNLAALSLNTPWYIGLLDGGSKWEIDIYVYIPEGSSLSQVTFNLHLVYTPTRENPP